MADPTASDPTVELKRFLPFSRLGNEKLWLLSTMIEAIAPAEGEELFRCGDRDEREYFLVDGEVRLTAKDGARRSIAATDDIARHPIARLRPRQFTAVAGRRARLIVVDAALLSRLGSRGVDHFGIVELESDGGDGGGATVFAEIQADLARDRLRPVTLGRLTQKLRRRLDGQPSPSLVLAVARSDPWLAYRLLRALNDPILGAGRTEATVAAAIPLVGVEATYSLLRHYLDELEVAGPSAVDPDLFEACYRDAIVVAHLAEALAVVLGEPDSEVAFTAGLLHNLGDLQMLQYRRQPGEDDDEGVCAQIAALLLNEANVPLRLVTAVRDCRDWERDGGDAADLCDVVIAARAIAAIGQIGRQRPPRLDRIAACRRLGIDRLEPTRVAAMLQAARSRASQILA